jgi:hypothetical protein
VEGQTDGRMDGQTITISIKVSRVPPSVQQKKKITGQKLKIRKIASQLCLVTKLGKKSFEEWYEL